MRIEKIDGWVKGRNRQCEGVVHIGMEVLEFEVDTEDGMTAIHVKLNEGWLNLEYDVEEISGQCGEDLYDELLYEIEDAGFGINRDE